MAAQYEERIGIHRTGLGSYDIVQGGSVVAEGMQLGAQAHFREPGLDPADDLFPVGSRAVPGSEVDEPVDCLQYVRPVHLVHHLLDQGVRFSSICPGALFRLLLFCLLSKWVNTAAHGNQAQNILFTARNDEEATLLCVHRYALSYWKLTPRSYQIER